MWPDRAIVSIVLDSYCYDRLGSDRKENIALVEHLPEGRLMFGKKKAVATKGVSYQCQVPGCGLDCTDEQSLKRHMDWAHSPKAASNKPPETPNYQR